MRRGARLERLLGVAEARRRAAQAELERAQAELEQARAREAAWAAARRAAGAPLATGTVHAGVELWPRLWLMEPLAREHGAAVREAALRAEAAERAREAVLDCRRDEERLRRWLSRRRREAERAAARRWQRALDDLASRRRGAV